MFFDDVRPEDYVPEHAGGKSRVDFVLKSEKLVVETKIDPIRQLGAREVGEELIIDIERYPVRTLTVRRSWPSSTTRTDGSKTDVPLRLTSAGPARVWRCASSSCSSGSSGSSRRAGDPERRPRR